MNQPEMKLIKVRKIDSVKGESKKTKGLTTKLAQISISKRLKTETFKRSPKRNCRIN